MPRPMTRPPSPVPAPPPATDPSRLPLLLVAAVLAATMPSLLAFNVSPSPTFWNQALALGLWGGFVLMVAAGMPSAPGFRASREAAPVQLALAVLGAAALWSGTAGSLPASLCLSSLGLLGAAALLVHAGAAARGSDEAIDLFALFCWGWLVAGVLNLGLGLVQVFAPSWPDGDWIAVSNIVGRAVGQPAAAQPLEQPAAVVGHRHGGAAGAAPHPALAGRGGDGGHGLRRGADGRRARGWSACSCWRCGACWTGA